MKPNSMNYKFLIVEDDEMTSEMMINLLESIGSNQVFAASNGREGCEQALEHQPDLILMDWEMPEMNGISAVQLLQQSEVTKDIPVIMFTDFSTSEHLEKGLSAGAVDYIKKTFDKVEVIARIKSALRLHDSLMEVKRQKIEVEKQKKKADELLLNIMPLSVVQELKLKGNITPKYYKRASVVFMDFLGFTRYSEEISPKELIGKLDSYFSKFDDIIEKYNLEKIKTIGDAYMCVDGIPNENNKNPINAVLAALEIQRYVNHEVENNGIGWKLRIGIHTGEVIAGVIGIKKFAYDIWGETVNTASRMESSGEQMKVNISSITYEYIKEYFDCYYRGKQDVKNHEPLEMFFVEKIKPEFSVNGDGITPTQELLKVKFD